MLTGCDKGKVRAGFFLSAATRHPKRKKPLPAEAERGSLRG